MFLSVFVDREIIYVILIFVREILFKEVRIEVGGGGKCFVFFLVFGEYKLFFLFSVNFKIWFKYGRI